MHPEPPYPQQPVQPGYGHPYPQPGYAPPPPPPPMRNGLGTAGFVLGAIGLIFSFIPIIGVIAWPLVILGLILGLIGFNRARTGGANNRGLALAGVIMSAVGLVVCILYVAVFSAAVASSTPTSAAAGGSAAAGATHAFSEVAAGGDVSFSVSQPTAFTPSSSAAGATTGRAVKMNVTVTNTGTAPYAFNPFTVNPRATAGGVPAAEIVDLTNRLGVTSQSTILPGKSLTYAVAFAVPKAPGEFQIELSSSLFGDPVVFTGSS
jgi:hypothetical protein